MNSKQLLAGTLALAAAACFVFYPLLQDPFPNGPVHQGKPLKEWLALRNSDHPRDLTAASVSAIQSMGTNAIPALLQTLSWKESAVRHWMRMTLRNQRWLRLRLDSHNSDRMSAAAGFSALGPQAASAVPRLIELLEDDQTSYGAALALASIGEPAVPSLVASLTNSSVLTRAGSVQTLNFMHGAKGTELAVLGLEARLKDPDPTVRSMAMTALEDLRKRPREKSPP